MESFTSKIEEEHKPDLEPENTICRCCLTTEKRMLNISLFVSHFLDLAGLNVSESDGLPPWICHECAGLLQKALRFKRKLLKANTMLCDYLMRCAPFPIEPLDPELMKYSSPNLKESNTLAFDNGGRKLGFYKTLQHEKRPVASALDSVELPPPPPPPPLPPPPPPPAQAQASLAEPLKVEYDSFSDYEDNITLEEFRSIVPKTENEVPDESLVKLEEDSKKKKKTKKKEQPKAKRKKSKEPAAGEEPKTSIRKTVELDPTKIRVVMLNPEEQFRQSEEESKAKFPYQCHLCYKGFNFDTKLENHMRKHSPSRGRFSCALCTMYFPSAYSRGVHAHIHTRRYECCACGRRMIDRASILDHYRTQHEGLVSHFTCHLCGKVSNNSKTHRGHMRNHHSGQRPECEQCGKTFVNKDSLEEHRQIHQGIKNYSCSECGKRFRTRTQIKHHQLKHTDVKEYYCVECDVRIQQGIKNCSCSECGKRFRTRTQIKHHQLKHTDVKEYYCVECDVRIQQGIKNCSCSECGKRFRTRTQIKHHQLKHTDVKEYYCVECDVRFKSAHSLRQHLVKSLKHKDKQSLKFACARCDKRYESGRALARHAAVQHDGLRSYLCGDCPAALASRASLAKHRRHVHQGARPAKRHVCDACGKAFRGKSVLINHVRTHTGEKPFSCATCGRKFSQRTAMRTHVDLVHLKRRRGKAKQEPAAPEEPKELFTKEEHPLVFDAWRQNMPGCEVYFTVTAGP